MSKKSYTKKFNNNRVEEAKRRRQELLSSSNNARKTAQEIGMERLGKKFGIDTFESDLKSMGETINSIYNEWQTPKTMKETRTSVEKMKERIDAYQEYQKRYGGADVSELSRGYKKVLRDWDDISTLYQGYKNADSFNTAKQKAQFDEQFKGLTYDEVQSEMKKHGKDSDEYKYLSGYTGYTDLNDFNKAVKNAKSDYKEDIEKARNRYELDHKFDLYKHHMEADDFKKKSQYKSTATKNFLSPYKDETYEFINNVDGARDFIIGKYKEGNGATWYEQQGYDRLEPEEIAVYNYLYAQDKDLAEEFLKDMEVNLQKRTHEASTKIWEEMADSGPVQATLLSLASPITNMAGGIGAGIDMLTGNTNPYSPLKTPSNFTHDTRGYIGENIAEATEGMELFGQNIPSFLYQTGMSIGDSALGAMTLGRGNTLVMGANAYQQKAKELIEAGENPDTVRNLALANGIAEAAFEYISIDKLLKIKNSDSLKTFLKQTAKQGGIEASEEFFTELSNLFWDDVFRGDSSELGQIKQDLLARGYSEEEANRKVKQEVNSRLGWATAGGFISGAGMGGFSSGSQLVRNTRKGVQIKGNDRVNEMRDMSSMTPEASEAYKVYTEYANKGINADNITDAQLGNLYNTAYSEADATLKSRKSSFGQKVDASKVISKLNTISTEKVTKTKSGEEVKVEGIKMEDGKETFVTDKGEFSKSDLSLSGEVSDAIAYAKTFNDESKANAFISQYDGATNIDKYAHSFELAYTYGESMMDSSVVLENKGVLTERQAAEIWKAGMQNRNEQETIELQKKIDEINHRFTEHTFSNGIVDDSIIDYDSKDSTKVKWNTLTRKQRNAITFVKAFAEGTGVNLRFIQSKVVDGKRTGENGSYNPETNTIEIDVYAGVIDAKALNDSIISTVSHEVTHWMKNKSPVMYKNMQDLVLDVVSQGRKLSVNDLIAESRNKLDENHKERKHSDDEAIDEIVARGCEDMLSNSKYAREILGKMSHEEQKTFVGRLKATIENLTDWVDELLNEYKSGSIEARTLREYKDKLNELSKMWDKALAEAIQTNQSMQTETGWIGENFISDTNAMFSIRTYENEGRELLHTWLKNSDLDDSVRNEIIEQMDYVYEVATQFAKDNELIDFSSWSETDVIRRNDGSLILSVVVPNGEYPLNIDFSQICKKRKVLNTVLNALVRSGDLDLRTLSQSDIGNINRIIKEHGFEIACALCFVDSKRYRVNEWADSFADTYNSLVKSLVKGTDLKVDEFNYTGRSLKDQEGKLLKDADDSELNFDYINKVLEKNSSGKAIYRYALAIKNNKELRSTLNSSEIISSAGLDAIKVQNEKLYALVNSHQGSAKPKLSHSENPYGYEILLDERFNPEDAYKVGGVRIQSFSDYMATMFFDYVQMIGDLSAKKLPAHAYTKEYYFAKLFGLTGIKINMSIVPKGADISQEQKDRFNKMTKAAKEKDAEFKRLKSHAGLDAEGNYILEDETFPLDKALELQNTEGYDKNCGIIWVGVSDKHIEKMLSDDNVPFIIPYHKSSLNPAIARMRNIDFYNDYTKSQNTRYDSKAKKKVPSRIWSFDFYADLAKTNDPRQTAENYKNECKARGYLPVFDQFAEHPNYYKLIVDFRVYDKNGNYAPQGAVEMKFPDDFNKVVKESLSEAQDNQNKLDADMQNLLDEIRSELKLGQKQYSDRDSSYMNAVEEGNLKKAQKMVEKAAKENGYTIHGYHGTDEGGFTVFDTKYSDDGISLFVAKNKETAQSYTSNYSDAEIDLNSGEKQEGLYRLGVKIENPYVIDAKGKNWNQLVSDKIKSRYYVRIDMVKENGEYKYLATVKEYGVKDKGRFYENAKGNMAIEDTTFDTAQELVNSLPKGMASTLKQSILKQITKSRNTNMRFYDTMSEVGKTKIEVMHDVIETNSNGERIGLRTTRDWSKYAKEHGHDGVIIKNVWDSGKSSKDVKAERGDIYIAFNSEQIKALNSVTYDNKGNIIPLSKRFDDSKKDIRFSDRDSDGTQLTKAQIEYFKDSKIRDENGNLLVMYHGTKGDFTVFDRDFIGSTGAFEGAGFNFTPSYDRAKSYGGNVMKVYLNVSKPLSHDKKTISVQQLANIIRNIDPTGDNIIANYAQETRDYGTESFVRRESLVTARAIVSYAENDVDIYSDLSTGAAERHLIVEGFAKLGYDGAIHYADDGSIKTVITFDSNQAKNIDNTNPTEAADIRFSDRDIDTWLDKFTIDELLADLIDLEDLGIDTDSESVQETITKKQRAKRRVDEVNKRLKEIGLSFNGTKTVAWTDERIDTYLSGGYYGASNPIYAQAYITYMTPHQFLNLTMGGHIYTVDRILSESETYGELDFDKIGNSEPINLDIEEGKNGAKVVGHEGRHRMYLLGKAGFEKVPVLMFEYKTKYTKTHKDSMKLATQNFSNDAFISKTRDVVVSDVIPFSQGNRDLIIEKFGSGNKVADIHFSDRDNVSVYEAMGEEERLIAENQRLKEDIARLKGAISADEVPIRRFRSLADYLNKLSGSNMKRETLGDLLEEVYTYIQTTDNLQWNDVVAKTYDIANSMMNRNMDVPINYFKEVMSQVRKDKVSLSAEQRAEAEKLFGGYGNFHKAMFGRVNIVNSGTPLAEMWQTWSKLYPSVFKADVNEADQLKALVDTVDTLKATSTLMGEYEREEAIRHLATEIYNQFWNIASDSSEDVKKAKAEHRKMMEELRKGYEQRQKEKSLHPVGETALKYEKLLKKVSERDKAAIKKAKELGKQRVSDVREKAEKKSKIQKITKNTKLLGEWLTKNTKDKHISQELKGPVRNLLVAIDFASKGSGIDTSGHSEALAQIGQSVEEAKRNVDLRANLTKLQIAASKDETLKRAGVDFSDDIEKLTDSIERMNVRKDALFVLHDMSLDDLVTLDRIVTSLKTVVTRANKYYTMRRKQTITASAHEMFGLFDSLGDVKEGKFDGVRNFFNYENITPINFFDRLGEVGQDLFKSFIKAQSKLAFNAKLTKEFSEKTWDSKDVKKWDEDLIPFEVVDAKKTKDITKPVMKKVYTTTSRLMTLYLHDQREQSKGHLYKGGGGRFTTFEHKGKTIGEDVNGIVLTPGLVQQMLTKLDPKAKRVADAISEFLNTTCKDWGNEITTDLYGTELFLEPKYVPIEVIEESVSREMDKPQRSVTALLNKGFTKETKPNAKNQIVLDSIFNVFAKHTSEMMAYNAFAREVYDAVRLFEYNEDRQTFVYDDEEGQTVSDNIQTAMKGALGKGAVQYFRNFLEDINGTQQVGRGDSMLGKSFSNFKLASVAWNMNVALLQPISLVRAITVIHPKYLAKGMLGIKKGIKGAMDHSGTALWKSFGFYDTDIAPGLAEQIKNDKTFGDKLKEASMKAPEVMDRVSWGALWTACEYQVADQNKALRKGSPEYYDKVADLFDETVYRTQVMDSTLTRSQIMRSKSGLMKGLTSFMAEPLVTYNMVYGIFSQWNQHSRSGHTNEQCRRIYGKKLAGAIGVYCLSSVAEAAIRSLTMGMRNAGGDDDEEEDENVFLDQLADNLNPLSKIPVARELLSAWQGYGVSEIPGLNAIEACADAYKSISKMIMEGDEISYKKVYKILKAASYGTGHGMSNAHRDIVAIWNSTIAKIYPSLIVNTDE